MCNNMLDLILGLVLFYNSKYIWPHSRYFKDLLSFCFCRVLLHYMHNLLSNQDFSFVLFVRAVTLWLDLLFECSTSHSIFAEKSRWCDTKEDVVENVPAVRSNDIFSITDVHAIAWGTYVPHVPLHNVLQTHFVTRVHSGTFFIQSSCLETQTCLIILHTQMCQQCLVRDLQLTCYCYKTDRIHTKARCTRVVCKWEHVNWSLLVSF